MSSGSLISSLFRDNSFSSRSSSMFQKSFTSTNNDLSRNRSQSAFRDKVVDYTGSNKYLPVARMGHMLSVKLRKLNYFLFCRLQANYKKLKDEKPGPQFKSTEIQIIQSSKVTAITRSSNIQDRVNKGLQSLCQFIQLKELKLQSCSKVQYAFKLLKQNNKKKQASNRLFKLLNSKYFHNIQQIFKRFQKNQKNILKAEILTAACKHLLVPKIKEKFKLIREYAIQKKIKFEIEERERLRILQLTKKAKSIQLQKLLNLSSSCDRLKSIQQQHSGIFEQQQTARFITPEKKNLHNLGTPLNRQSGSKTSRKQCKYPVLNRKQTQKQHQLQESAQPLTHLSKNQSKKSICIQIQQRTRVFGIRASTKKQSQKPKISIGKSYRIETALEDHKIIKLDRFTNNTAKQMPPKNNRLYSETISQPLPDLHDNMGVFEQVWLQQNNGFFSQDNLLSHRTVQKQKDNVCSVQNLIRLTHRKQTNATQPNSKQLVETTFKSDDQFQKTLDNCLAKQYDQPTITSCSRAMSISKSNPKMVVETGINTSNCATVSMCNLNSVSDQFHSSPLYRIQEMILDLEKLRQRQKLNSKYTTGYQKCKISVNLPSRKSSVYGGKSYQGSANKNNHSGVGKSTGVNQCRSDKKDIKRQNNMRYMCKQNNQPKQNIQVKLWDQKQKFLFYTDSKSKLKKERKRSSYIITSMNQSQINTARKMKKQIQGIINSRKNRTSLGNLKIAKSKY